MHDHAQVDTELRTALVERQFTLLYQPIFDLGASALVGFEALLRWDHPTAGQLRPEVFIPGLESTGLIVDVGHWVLLEACEQMATWRAAGSALMVSVNVASRELEDDRLVDHVCDALATSRLDPTALTIEVREAALRHNGEAVARRLRELRTLGVQVAIDDFGTGLSTLAYLQQFPVDCLKIDRSVTEAITRSPGSGALLHSLVQMGRDLGLKMLAAGVETVDQMSQLREEHVDAAQGFLFARPLSVDAIEEGLLRRPS